MQVPAVQREYHLLGPKCEVLDRAHRDPLQHRRRSRKGPPLLRFQNPFRPLHLNNRSSQCLVTRNDGNDGHVAYLFLRRLSFRYPFRWPAR